VLSDAIRLQPTRVVRVSVGPTGLRLGRVIRVRMSGLTSKLSARIMTCIERFRSALRSEGTDIDDKRGQMCHVRHREIVPLY
jgi:hypothetical protein